MQLLPKSEYVNMTSATVKRFLLPFYLVLTLSQFIVNLLTLVVGEKEKKIKEGLRMMGLKDSVYWLSWFLIYLVFVLLLTSVTTVMLYVLGVCHQSNGGLVFLLLLLYDLSVLALSFMITPFFDNAKLAGVFGGMSTSFLNLFYYIQVATGDSTGSYVYWMLGFISPTGFALGMDKILLLEMNSGGVNYETLWVGPGLPIAGSYIMLSIDIVLYMLLAFYLDNVLPSQYGSRQSPWFCLKPSFWLRPPPRKLGVDNDNYDNYDGSVDNGDIEALPASLRGKEAVTIRALTKTFKAFGKAPVQAVQGLSLDIYEGQITAILGHNGAGKTTLFNILTGMTSSDQGSASIYGLDVSDSNEMQEIRRMTGVCPQHDVLFDPLTPREHLVFFARIRGVPENLIELETEKTLKDIDLAKKADTVAAKLSGGQKRKLSIGIALIGDPKIVFLDEPTAGVDPFSRRKLWKLLQERKAGKVILLTTHFMDEADLLADRKAIITKGKLRCLGSSLFLKNKFGVGYHLTFVLNENFKDVGAVRSLVEDHVPDTVMNRHFGRELSYVLPRQQVSTFPALFTKLESLVQQGLASAMGFNSYGVSMTTLEEVFLKIGEEAELEKENLRTTTEALEETLDEGIESTWDSLNNLNIAIVEKGMKRRTMAAMLKIRWLTLLREPMAIFFQCFMPVGFAALGIWLGTLQPTPASQDKTLFNLGMYADVVNRSSFLYSNAAAEDMNPFWKRLAHHCDVNLQNYSGDFANILQMAPHWLAVDTEDSIHVPAQLPYKHTRLRFNDSLHHLPPLIINAISNTLLKDKHPDMEITLSVHTLPSSDVLSMFNAGQFTSAMFIGILFVLAPTGLVSEIVSDRENHIKNLLRVNGLTFGIYFGSFFSVLGSLMVISCLLIVLMIFAFQLQSLTAPAAIAILTALYLLYCPASILFATCVSYIFKTMESAQSIFPNVASLVGMVPYIVVMLCDIFQVGGSTTLAKDLHITFCFVDVLYIPYAILYFINRTFFQCLIRPGDDVTSAEELFGYCGNLPFSAYMTVEIWIIPLALLVHIFFYFTLLVVIDVKHSGGLAADALPFLKWFWPVEETDVVVEDINVSRGDSDVQAEALRVQQLLHDPSAASQSPVVLIHGLHKKYAKTNVGNSSCCSKKEGRATIKPAVNALSFAVEKGEVFGLLGHNGAGKTTTMKVITAEESPTRGRIQVAGHDIRSNQSAAFRALGYCPQHDALFRNITVRGHMEAYAAIRGIAPSHINKVVDLYLHGLQIEEHASKFAKNCSGGTRRKLSYALSMLGRPAIVLMDEPSTGMDPQSKRFLWNTISASFQGERGAILTTHSMEEADALCSRLGIMVKGEMSCIGTGQHLKNRYGSGYLLEIKLKSLASESNGLAEQTSVDITRSQRKSRLNTFVVRLFPTAAVHESFEDRIIFNIAQHSVLSLAHTFESLENARERLHIEEYSFSQTTLEQVFIKFANEQVDDDEEDDVDRDPQYESVRL